MGENVPSLQNTSLLHVPNIGPVLARIFDQAFYCEGQYTALYETSAFFPNSTYFNMSSPEKMHLVW